MRTRRDGEMMRVEIILRERTIGTGVLQPDPFADPPLWVGTVHLDECEWWATSLRGSGVVRLSVPRGVPLPGSA
jgi:hypothetical protein